MSTNNSTTNTNITETRQTSKKLEDRLAAFENVPILVVGDLILDHYIWGKVERISPEAPVVVVNVVDENRRLGGAGNVAHNLVSLGAKVYICGVVGDDNSGREFISMLENLGVDSSGVLVDRTRPTTVKTRVIAHAQQVVRVDREDSSPLNNTYREALSATAESLVREVQGVIVSDYGKGALSQSLIQRVILSAQKIAVDSDSRSFRPVLVDPKSPNFEAYKGATIIKPNRKEAEEASGKKIRRRSDAIEVAQLLLDKWSCDLVLITLGDQGLVLVSRGSFGEQQIEIDTQALEVYDVSGAGDTVSATFALALASGSSVYEAALIANHAAGIVVGEVGTVAINKNDLMSRIREQ